MIFNEIILTLAYKKRAEKEASNNPTVAHAINMLIISPEIIIKNNSRLIRVLIGTSSTKDGLELFMTPPISYK